MLLRIRNTLAEDGKITSSKSDKLPYERLQASSRARQNGQGSQTFASWKIFLNSDADILSTDLISYNGKQYGILEIYPVKDQDDNLHHIEVWV